MKADEIANPEPDEKEREIYGSFFLSGNEFALSVTHVQEVVNPPERYTTVPLAPPYLLGLFNLRGTIIPVVDLRILLKLPVHENGHERKVAILENHGHCVGLLFDRTGEIFKSQPDERSDFADRGKGSVLRGMFKKDGGQRLIQLLDVNALFDLGGIPRDEDANRKNGRRAQRNSRGLRKQCISFTVGPARCALGIGDIHEILKIEKLSDTALGTGHCTGVIDLRGTVVPVIDFASMLGYREKDTSEDATSGNRRVIVMRLGNELFGLLVDGIDSIVSFFDDDLKPFPEFTSPRRKMFKACISLEGGADILLLDHQEILSNEEIQAITHGHSKIYQSKEKLAGKSKDGAGSRRTFITFKVGGSFAVRIGEIKEIIEMPTTLLQPPGLPPYCKGVLNLRGDLVPVVDARALYSVMKEDRPLSPKVLIFKTAAYNYALVVDSVEGIISINDESKQRIPDLLFAEAGGLAVDVTEAIQCKDLNGEPQNLLILNAGAIGKRLSHAS